MVSSGKYLGTYAAPIYLSKVSISCVMFSFTMLHAIL